MNATTSAIVPISQAKDTTIALTDYKPNGIGHIGILGGLTVAGFQIFALTASPLMIIPFAGVGVYTLIRNSKYGRSPDWIAARDAAFHYRFAGQPTLAEAYPVWCQCHGKQLVNSIIESMIGQVMPYDFLKDKRHPYYGSKGVYCYDDPDDNLIPLTPWHYCEYKLKAMNAIADRAKALDTDPEAIHKLSAEIKSQKEAPAIDVPATESGEMPKLPVGNQTKLNAVDVPARPVTTAPTVAALLGAGFAQPLQPQLILGAPGSGKGMYAAYALSFAATKHRAETWILDPKSDQSEAGYWQYATRHYLKDPCLNDLTFGVDVLKVIVEFERRVSDRKNGEESKDNPLILFIDEVNTVSSNLTKAEVTAFGAKVMSLASQSRSQNAAIWLGGQCAILELLGIRGSSNRAVFSQVICVHGDEPHKAISILGNLGMDKTMLESCKAGSRYWVTPGGVVTAPKMTELVSDGWGQNVIDLRPRDEQPEQTDLTLPKQPTEVSKNDVFALIQSLLPNVGDKVTCRNLYKNKEARKLGVNSGNAETFLKELAMLRGDRFGWFEDEVNNGSVTKGVTRIRPE